jgi:hypothetical protein
MALSFDLTGLPLLQSEIAVLVATQAATPTAFTGGTVFNTTANAARSGILPAGIPQVSAPGPMTTGSLVQRLQALLLLAQSLPL